MRGAGRTVLPRDLRPVRAHLCKDDGVQPLNAEEGKITPEHARERSTEPAKRVKQAREQATHHVSEATALLDEALETADE